VSQDDRGRQDGSRRPDSQVLLRTIPPSGQFPLSFTCVGQ